MSDEIQEEVALSGPGAVLKKRRESLRLTVEEIAGKLHLRPAVVADIEGDIIDHSVSTTFTKGYVRLYAKHMDMDPEPLLQAFDEVANPIKQPAKLQSFSQKMAKQASDKRLMMLSYFILFAVMAMAVVWWFQQTEETATLTTSQVATQASEAQPTGTQPRETPSDLTSALNNSQYSSQNTKTALDVVDKQDSASGSGDPEPASTIGDSEQKNSEDTLLTPEPERFDGELASTSYQSAGSDELLNTVVEGTFTDTGLAETDVILVDTILEVPAVDLSSANVESVTGTEPVTTELVFTFVEDCWINLTDATGENIAYGIKTAGRVMPVSGIPPFEVVIAQPQVVQLTVDGEAFDLTEFPAGRTARFVIGE